MVKALAKSPKDSVGLVELLSDENERDAILDHEVLYRTVLEDAGCLRLSPAFYFYILTRRVLRKAGIEERALCDYVSAVLTAFSRTNQLCAPVENKESSSTFLYISDLLEKLSKAPPQQAYLLRSHLGDYTLFLSGIFAERVEAHAQRRGAPGMTFYESVGQTSYRSVASHPNARQSNLQLTFEQLADQFRIVRLALNQLADNLMHIAPAPRIAAS